jgi:hypothetical protein
MRAGPKTYPDESLMISASERRLVESKYHGAKRPGEQQPDALELLRDGGTHDAGIAR